MNLRLRIPRRRPREVAGIRIRISTPSGVVVDADSLHLYYSALFAGAERCTRYCLPGCNEHGWLNLIAGGGEMPTPGAGEWSVVPLKIEIKPAHLRTGSDG